MPEPLLVNVTVPPDTEGDVGVVVQLGEPLVLWVPVELHVPLGDGESSERLCDGVKVPVGDVLNEGVGVLVQDSGVLLQDLDVPLVDAVGEGDTDSDPLIEQVGLRADQVDV